MKKSILLKLEVISKSDSFIEMGELRNKKFYKLLEIRDKNEINDILDLKLEGIRKFNVSDLFCNRLIHVVYKLHTSYWHILNIKLNNPKKKIISIIKDVKDGKF